jgi:CheY-like chemotaxis protein
MHHGSIEVHSDGPGRGATFVVSLPYTPGAEPGSRAGEVATQSQPAAAPRRDLRQVRVLIVDDDADTLEMMSILAEEAGAEVKSALNARDALRLVREWSPDVLLSDISMPDEDGFALIRRVRALPAREGGHTPAAAITAMATGEDRDRVLAAGFQAHVAKPLEFDVLVQTIASLLRPDSANDTLH